MSLIVARVGDWFQRRPVLRFVIAVLALLPAAFLLWYAVGPGLAAPAALLADAILNLWIGDFVEETQLRGHDLIVVSSFSELGHPPGAIREGIEPLAFAINTRLLSYSIPFYAALYFATPMRGGIHRFAWGLIALWLLLALGLVAVAVKDLMLGVGAPFLEAPLIPPADGIALAYQFSTLMVPMLAPVLLWAYAARDSETLLSLLPLSLRPAHSSD